jgi:hypothetical protein
MVLLAGLLLGLAPTSAFATTYTLQLAGPSVDDQGSCNLYTISRVYTTSGKPAPLTGPTQILLALAGNGSGNFYGTSDTTCSGAPVTSVALLRGNYQATFSFKDSVVETLTLSVSFTGYTPGSEGVTIKSTSAENTYCLPGDVANFGTVDGKATLPTACVYTDLSGSPAPGTTLNVPSLAYPDLPTALANVACGQKIVIAANVSGSPNVISTASPFTLPNLACDKDHWIWIESDQTGASGFPAEHVRATPCAIGMPSLQDYPSYSCSSSSNLMPTIMTNGMNHSVFVAAAGANHYRLIGLNITKAAGVTVDNKLVDLSNGADHIIFDRDLIHGVPLTCNFQNGSYTCNVADELQGGINANNSTHIALINSWAYDTYCTGGCIDSQAFSTGTGGSVEQSFKLYNNLLASSGESWISGGGGQGAGNNTPLATDFEIRQNHSFKPVSWALGVSPVLGAGLGQHPIFKNNGEFKNTNRALMEANVFENSWTGWQTDQAGFQFLITPKNQSNPTAGIKATSDGSGTLTATKGTFPQSLVSQFCATPFHCNVEYNRNNYQAQTWTDSTHLVVSPAPPSSNGTSYDFTGDQPGLCPTCAVHNVTVRYNEFRNSVHGIQFATAKSSGGDTSLGMDTVEIHDNLFQGANNNLSNSFGANLDSGCFEIENAQTTNPVNNFSFEHNTCVIATFPGSSSPGSNSYSGLDNSLDTTDTTTDGSTGAYISNRTVQNNIGSAGGLATYKQGTLYPGGLYAGLQQQSCTPPVTGTTCTWIYTHNVLGLGLWTKQRNNAPFPCTNADPGSNCGPTGSSGIGCTAGGVTCFPMGSAFVSQFVNYNGPAGQAGYLGDYHLASSSPYINQGTDGANIGANVDKILLMTANVRSDTTYPSATITTFSLPNATVGTPYSQQLAGTGASDMRVWTLASGSSLPTWLTLDRSGNLHGIPPTNSSGTYNFTVQMMDAAQQYATQPLALTVQ